MIKKLWPLAMGGIAIGTTEFLIMGLLRNIGEDMQLTDAVTGHFISAYALGVVVGAPILVALASKHNAKRVLLWLMVLFTIFNGISALMPDYKTFLLARFFSGLPHGAFFGVGAISAKTLAPKGKEAMAISIMFAGLTFANLAAVPILTYVGNEMGWRLAMGIIALLGILTFVSVWAFLPDVAITREVGIKDEIRFFFNKKSLTVLAITALGCGGLFAWLSYIQPLMMETTQIEKSMMPSVMILAGTGMVVGNLFGGWLADKIAPLKASIVILILLVMTLLAVFSLAHIPLWGWVLTFVCGIMSMSLGAPLNMMIFRSAPQSEMMGAAFMQAAFNVANTLGAYLGGLPLAFGLATNFPSLVGASMAFVGLLLCLYFARLK